MKIKGLIRNFCPVCKKTKEIHELDMRQNKLLCNICRSELVFAQNSVGENSKLGDDLMEKIKNKKSLDFSTEPVKIGYRAKRDVLAQKILDFAKSLDSDEILVRRSLGRAYALAFSKAQKIETPV